MLNPKDFLPDLNSSFESKVLDSDVEIYRDKWGIPHISAKNEKDLFFAQGFSTAQDRLFQMDLDRLRCLGRSSEYLGNKEGCILNILSLYSFISTFDTIFI